MPFRPLVVLLAISTSWPAAADIALIQKQVGYAQGPVFALPFDSANTAGNAVVVFAFWEDSTRAAAVFDSQGNAYASTPQVTNPWQPPDRGSMAQFYFATDIQAGPNTVTIEMQPDAGTGYHSGIAILEYSGLDPAPFDGTANAISPDTSNAASTPFVSISGAEDLLLGGFNDTNGSGTIDAGPGWTSQLINVPFYILVEDRLVRDGGSHQALAAMPNGDADWAGVVLALKASPPPVQSPGRYSVGCGCDAASRSWPAAALLVAAAVLGILRRSRGRPPGHRICLMHGVALDPRAVAGDGPD